MLLSLSACAAGFIMDFFFGDPSWIYHPVCMIGKLITFCEKRLRSLSGKFSKRTEKKLLVSLGAVLWFIVCGVSFAVPFFLLSFAELIHPAARPLLETFWCWQIFAARSLVRESRKVYDRLKENDLHGAREAVSMIVGRDTARLSPEGVAKAAVETVAENTSDGVTAPMLFMLLGGAPLGFLYKAVNTMDSMLGYKNDRYMYFGRFPARMDDLFNYIPSRLTAIFMIAAAFFTGEDGKNAFRIWCRDRRKHASPNSAQTESVCAGALGVRLAGDAYYFGKRYQKEYIGDESRSVEPEDIKKSARLMYVTALLMLAVIGGTELIISRFY